MHCSLPSLLSMQLVFAATERSYFDSDMARQLLQLLLMMRPHQRLLLQLMM